MYSFPPFFEICIYFSLAQFSEIREGKFCLVLIKDRFLVPLKNWHAWSMLLKADYRLAVSSLEIFYMGFKRTRKWTGEGEGEKCINIHM